MSWGIQEGSERSPNWREENNDIVGSVLLWDGVPVDLPLRPFFTSWTTPADTRHHITTIPFENGWSAEIRLEEGPPLFGVTPEHLLGDPGPRLTLCGANSRALAFREQMEEAGLVEMYVGDEWDFSYDKTGYEYPGAYVQWYLLASGEMPVDVEKIARLFEEGPWARVPDLETLQSRLQFIAALPSDPEAAAEIQRMFGDVIED